MTFKAKIINFPEENIIPKATDYFELIEPIILETRPECQIGRIDKLVVKNELIFIEDYHQKILFIFGLDGKYKSKINAVGKGPGEYRNLNDFYIDYNNKIIEILENRKIVKYSFSGRFIEEISLKRSAFNFHKTKNGNYYFWIGSQYLENDAYTLIYTDNKGKIINKHFPWDKKGHLLSNSVMFSEYGDNILFRPFAQDYNIRYLGNKGEINTAYVINFGKFAIPSAFKQDDKCLAGRLSAKEVLDQNYSHHLYNIFETEDYLIFNLLIGNNKVNNFIYSKKLSKSVNSELSSKDDVLPHALLQINAVDGKYLYSNLDPLLWLEFVQPRIEKSFIRNDRLLSVSKSIKYNDNPIIFRLKINNSIFQ